MRRGFACLAVLAGWLGGATAIAQTPAYAPPRTPDGKLDLGGVWVSSDNVGLERADGAELGAQPGERRASLIIDPPDGKLPLGDRASAMAWRQKYGRFVIGGPMPEFTLGPETLPNRDRCLMAANAAAPPMISQGEDDAHQIVQTPSYILIAVELMDEARIVPVFPSANEARQAHGPSVLQRWTGDSVGWWEDDTFVVETTSINAKQGAQSPTPMSKDAMVVERFTRVRHDELLYRAEVSDPALFTRPWTIEYSFHPTSRLWEYACHEGNYGMAGILSGARKIERDMAGAKSGKRQKN